MKEETLNYFRGMLVLQRIELHAAASRTVSDMKADSGKPADSLDRAVAEFDRQMELSIRGRDRFALHDIQQALQRIDQGSFGVCEMCGKPISEGRLMARPTTHLCLRCQHQQEKARGKAKRRLSVPRGKSCHPALRD